MRSDVSSLVRKLGDWINQPWKRNTLFQEKASWEQLFSSIDAIEDAELALSAYEQLPEPSNPGQNYILIYGLLQILFVQQDAISHLAEALGLEYTPDPLLAHIREIRNSSIGHPTKRKSGVEFNFISRITMNKSGFHLMTSYPDDRPPTFREVDLPELISKQGSVLESVLEKLVVQLQADDMNHREEHRDLLMRDAFPPTFNYHISKVGEAVYGSRPFEVCLIDLEFVEKALSTFVERLRQRGEDGAYQSVDHLLDVLKYPIMRLRSYMTEQDSDINKKDAYIYFAFMADRFEELKEIAEEIDEAYNRQTNNP